MNSYTKNYLDSTSEPSPNQSSHKDFHSQSNYILKLKKEIQYYQEKSLESELDNCQMNFEYENQRNKLDEQLLQKTKLNQVLLQTLKENKENLEKLKEDVRTLNDDLENNNKERQILSVKLNQGIDEVKNKYESMRLLHNPDYMLQHLTNTFDLMTLNAINLQLLRVFRNKSQVNQEFFLMNSIPMNQAYNNSYNLNPQDEEDFQMTENNDLIQH